MVSELDALVRQRDENDALAWLMWQREVAEDDARTCRAVQPRETEVDDADES